MKHQNAYDIKYILMMAIKYFVYLKLFLFAKSEWGLSCFNQKKKKKNSGDLTFKTN